MANDEIGAEMRSRVGRDAHHEESCLAGGLDADHGVLEGDGIRRVDAQTIACFEVDVRRRLGAWRLLCTDEHAKCLMQTLVLEQLVDDLGGSVRSEAERDAGAERLNERTRAWKQRRRGGAEPCVERSAQLVFVDRVVEVAA